MTARVLVTGGTGFLGRQIVAALLRLGAEPIIFGAPRPDLLDREARRQAVRQADADILIHAAWITAPGQYWDSPENLDWVAATRDLVTHFALSGGQRVVQVGTCAEYDWRGPEEACWAKSRPCRPQSLYGAAKHTAWTALSGFARRTGLTAANARVFIPVGPHEAAARLLPSLIRAARSGLKLDLGPAELTRDFIDVRDAGEAIARVALSETQGPINIGSGEPVSLQDLVRMVGGRDHAIRLGGRPPRPGEPLRLVADPTWLRNATGFVPHYALSDSIAASVAAMQRKCADA